MLLHYANEIHEITHFSVLTLETDLTSAKNNVLWASESYSEQLKYNTWTQMNGYYSLQRCLIFEGQSKLWFKHVDTNKYL